MGRQLRAAGHIGPDAGPEEVDEAFAWALAKSPDARPATIEECFHFIITARKREIERTMQPRRDAGQGPPDQERGQERGLGDQRFGALVEAAPDLDRVRRLLPV